MKAVGECFLKCGAGWADGETLGTPICIMVPNTDQKSQDYSEMSLAYRPSHADAVYDMKYGIRAVAGGGRSSARETIGRVAAGAIAKKLLQVTAGVEVCVVLLCADAVDTPIPLCPCNLPVGAQSSGHRLCDGASGRSWRT